VHYPKTLPPGHIAVLHEDPNLGAALSDRALARAARVAFAPALVIERNEALHVPSALVPHFGLLLIEGTLGARTQVDDRSHLELLGPGDLIRPWISVGDDAPPGASMDWVVVDETRLAVLDRRFSAAVASWPELASTLMERLIERNRRLNLQVAIGSVKTVERRILLSLWHFASRWGRQTSDGMTLDLPLTHEQLGEIVMARRPTVTEALSRLKETGALSQVSERWILSAGRPHELEAMESRIGLVTPAPR